MFPTTPLYVLAAFGALSITRLVVSASSTFYRLNLHQSKLALYLEPDSHGRASWALITGASDGIGLEFAHQLCQRGANILLHGRNPDKLKKVQDVLRAKYSERAVELWVVDAGKADLHRDIEELVKMVQNLPDGGRLRILINNVGGSNAGIPGPMCQRFTDLGLKNIDTVLNINARFPILLTAALLPIMNAENTQSLVINMSSMAGVSALPYMVVYCACKAFNLHFSNALGAEMIAEGRNVQTIGILCGSVDTPGAPREVQNSPICIETDSFVTSALESIGSTPRIGPVGFAHTLTAMLNAFSPEGPVISRMKETFQRQNQKSKAT